MTNKKMLDQLKLVFNPMLPKELGLREVAKAREALNRDRERQLFLSNIYKKGTK